MQTQQNNLGAKINVNVVKCTEGSCFADATYNFDYPFVGNIGGNNIW